MGGAFPPARSQPARSRGPVALWAVLSVACTLFAPAASAASAEPHTETLAALADSRAAIAEIVKAEDRIVNSPNPYHRAARRAINAIVGESDSLFDKVSGNPGDAAGAIAHVDALLDRRDSPPWVDALHGVQVNLRAALARLRDALEARELEDYQIDVTSALLNLQAVVGQPTRTGVFGGLAGALATTTLGVPAGAREVSACAPIASAPAWGVKDGYLAFVSVPAATGTAGLPEDFGSRDVGVQGDRLIVRTAASGIVAALCGKRAAPANDPPAAASADDPPPAAKVADPSPALYTRAQAKAGKRVFLQHCVKCHGKNLQGTLGPAIAGTSFLQTAQRNHWSMYIIRYLVVNNMPLHSPGSLSKEQYADVLAYLLASSCYPAGDKPFPQQDDAELKNVELQPLAGAHPDNRKFGTCRG
jgi:polar amino acid transport system substrate-binding protein